MLAVFDVQVLHFLQKNEVCFQFSQHVALQVQRKAGVKVGVALVYVERGNA